MVSATYVMLLAFSKSQGCIYLYFLLLFFTFRYLIYFELLLMCLVAFEDRFLERLSSNGTCGGEGAAPT